MCWLAKYFGLLFIISIAYWWSLLHRRNWRFVRLSLIYFTWFLPRLRKCWSHWQWQSWRVKKTCILRYCFQFSHYQWNDFVQKNWDLWQSLQRVHKTVAAEAAEGNEKWGSKSEQLTKSGGVKRRMWTAYSKKCGSSDPLDPVAPWSLCSSAYCTEFSGRRTWTSAESNLRRGCIAILSPTSVIRFVLSWHPSNSGSLDPQGHLSLSPPKKNCILIGLALFTQLVRVPNTQTDHAMCGKLCSTRLQLVHCIQAIRPKNSLQVKVQYR